MTNAFKRVVVCMDGTWNISEVNAPDAHPTNVLRLARAVAMRAGDGTVQVVEYIPGVGTKNVVERWIGGVGGWGLRWNIQRAYEFIAHNYDHTNRDELYLFGFSRGAYSVRSLAGFIDKFGYWVKWRMNEFPILWELYQQFPWKTGTELLREARLIDHSQEGPPSGTVPIFFLGVWDTVGALGFPAPFRRFRKSKWDYHSVELKPSVTHARHALAIHEVRRQFAPDLWKEVLQDVRQVWFPGSHSDVGGGAESNELADIALCWMLDEAEQLGLSFDRNHLPLDPNPLAEIHYSWRYKPWWIRRPICRVISAASGVNQAAHASVVDRAQNRPPYTVWRLRDIFARECRALETADELVSRELQAETPPAAARAARLAECVTRLTVPHHVIRGGRSYKVHHIPDKPEAESEQPRSE